MTAIAAAADSRSAGRAARTLSFAVALVIGAALFGVLAGVLAADGKAIDVVGLTLVLLPVALWKRPQIGPILLLCVAVMFEQVVATTAPKAGWVPGIGDVLPPPPLLITSHVHIFEGIGSIHLEGADLLLFLVALVFLWRTKPAERAWPHSHVSRSLAWLLGAVLLGIFVGISHHGQMRVALMESRPYVYLAAAYVLTATLVRTRSALRGVLWAFVIASGVKAVQGVYEFFLVMSWHPRPEAVMGHEDAYTFGVYIFLVVSLWLFQAPMGKLRKVATWILPVVIAANLFNNRRAAWLLLGGGLIVLIVIGWRCLPNRREKLKKILIGVLIFCAGYIPAYWNKTGTFAQPARAIHSMISPDVRDAASNLYRTQEDANLKYNIRQGGVLGKGFGVPIDYALPIVDISKTDPEIKFIPHNGVLYIPMRMGLLGTIAFWTLLGTGIIAGCRLARSREREMAVVGSVLSAALVAYALEGATDQGFYFYRIAFITGVFLGLAEAARRIQRTSPLAFPSRLRSPSPAPAPTTRALEPAVTGAPTAVSRALALVPASTDVVTPLAPPRRLTLAPLPAERTLHTRLTGLSGLQLPEFPAPGDGSGSAAASRYVSSPIGAAPVAIISSNMPAPDAESEVERLVQRLGSARLADVVELKRRGSDEPPSGRRLSGSRTEPTGPFATLASAKRLRRKLRGEQPVVVYADGYHAALVSVIACVGRPTPIVWRRHDLRRRKLMTKLIGRRCRSVLTDGDAAATSHTAPRDRVRVSLDGGYAAGLDSDLGVILAAIDGTDLDPPAG